MNKILFTGHKSKQSNALNFTIKLASFQAVNTLMNNIKITEKPTSSNPTYIPYLVSQAIMDCVQKIKPEMSERIAARYTKNLALGIGLVTSAFVSVGFDGMDYFISFSLNLFRNSATTLIVDKINSLKMLDGISVAILLDFLMEMPQLISDASANGLIMTILFMVSTALLLRYNYKILKKTEDVNVCLTQSKKFKLGIGSRGYYNTALLLSSLIAGLVKDNVASGAIMMILNPIVLYILNNNSETAENINKYIQQNELYIAKIKHGEQTKKYINRMIMKNSIQVGAIGAVIFIIASVMVQVFYMSISPLCLAMIVNSFINLQFSTKAVLRQKRVKKLLNNIG